MMPYHALTSTFLKYDEKIYWTRFETKRHPIADPEISGISIVRVQQPHGIAMILCGERTWLGAFGVSIFLIKIHYISR